MTKWPLLYEDVLLVGNLLSNVAVCTLWSKKEKVASVIDPERFCVIGNLYRSAGISPMIRNIFANPTIRYVLLWGDDLSESGDSLIALWQDGLDTEGRIIGGVGRVESEIATSDIDQLRFAVQLIDLRGHDINELTQVCSSLPDLPAFSEPRTFPIPTIELPSVWPSEDLGFRLEGDLVAHVWLKILRTIGRYGKIKTSRYGNDKALKEVINLVAIVRSEDPESLYYPDYLPMGREELEQYYPQVLTARNIAGTSYTYGDRLRNYDGFDQISNLVDLIRERPDSKRMFATTWKVHVDSLETKTGDAPCLTQMNATVRDGRVLLTAHFRSQDMFSAWPMNMFAVRKLHKFICDQSSLELGPTMMITHSAHIYAWDWELAWEIVSQNEKEIRARRWSQDPRGYVLISLKGGRINVEVFSAQHDKLLELEDSSAARLTHAIGAMDVFVMPSHLMYIGREIQRAEIALQLGLTYVQDKRLLLSKD